MNIKLVEFTERDGNLEIYLTAVGRQKLHEDYGNNQTFLELIEYQLCNGWETIKPEEIGA